MRGRACKYFTCAYELLKQWNMGIENLLCARSAFSFFSCEVHIIGLLLPMHRVVIVAQAIVQWWSNLLLYLYEGRDNNLVLIRHSLDWRKVERNQTKRKRVERKEKKGMLSLRINIHYIISYSSHTVKMFFKLDDKNICQRKHIIGVYKKFFEV